MSSPPATLEVAYWEHGRVVTRTGAWTEMPATGVLWIDLGHRQLRGFDHYWVAWPRYGMTTHHDYGGINAIAWRWTDSGEVLSDPTPPPDAHIIDGVTVPDDIAVELGFA